MEEQKLTYFQKISLNNKSKDEQERINQLFEDNINLANKIAKKYYSTPYWDFDESIQIARLGLWKACLIWDPNKYKLSTLAYNIINRSFIDYDTQQKRQPDILFNLEDNCVTEDLSLSEILYDEQTDIEGDYEQSERIKELNQDILFILDDISDELGLERSIVKLVYLAYIENSTNSEIGLKSITFLGRSDINQIIKKLQEKLQEVIKP